MGVFTIILQNCTNDTNRVAHHILLLCNFAFPEKLSDLLQQISSKVTPILDGGSASHGFSRRRSLVCRKDREK